MKLKAAAVLSLVLLTGCAPSSPHDSTDRNHVSDRESEDKIKGVTYDKGPAHPTFWEMAFTWAGIK